MTKLSLDKIIVSQRKRRLDIGKVQELANSIAEIGLLHPIVVSADNCLVSGYHRLEAAKLLGWDSIAFNVFEGDTLDSELAEIDENLLRNDLTVLEQSEHLGRRTEILEEKGLRAKQSPGINQYTEVGTTVGLTTSDLAREIGLGKSSTKGRLQINKNIDPETKDRIRNLPIADKTTELLELARMGVEEQNEVVDLIVSGEVEDVKKAKKKIKRQEREKEIEAMKEDIANNSVVLPTGKFEVIVIDPPWPYGTQYDPDGRRAANPYPEMSLDEIKNIQLPATDDCILWLWTTHKFMRYSFEILDTWGFRDVSILTWAKDRMGLGQWLRSQSEFCIMAVKGKPLTDLTNQTTILHGKMREHSRKPDEFYELVNNLCVGRKLDYFSRESREGWYQYGNEVHRFADN